MQFRQRINPGKIALLLGVISVYLAVQSLISEYLLENVLNQELDSLMISFIDLFSVNAEETIPTWYATLILFISALLLAFITAVKYKNREPYKGYWLGLSFIFLYLSMDEGAVIHEIFADPLQATLNPTGYLAFAWQIVFVPLVIIFALLYFRFLFHLPPRIRNLFIVAGLLYVGGAVVVEALSANRWYLDGGVTFTYLTIGTVEELFEMLGVVVFIFALLSYMAVFHYTAVFDFSTTNESVPPKANDSSSKISIPWRWLVTGSIVLIVGFNLALVGWASAQQDAKAEAELQATTFYQTVKERYAGQGVIILGLGEVLADDNPNAPQIAASLLTLFEDVMVVTLPASQTSIAFASQALPFDEKVLTEIVLQSGVTEFSVLDTTAVKELAANPALLP